MLLTSRENILAIQRQKRHGQSTHVVRVSSAAYGNETGTQDSAVIDPGP